MIPPIKFKLVPSITDDLVKQQLIQLENEMAEWEARIKIAKQPCCFCNSQAKLEHWFGDLTNNTYTAYSCRDIRCLQYTTSMAARQGYSGRMKVFSA